MIGSYITDGTESYKVAAGKAVGKRPLEKP